MKKRLHFSVSLSPVLFFLGVFTFNSNNLSAQGFEFPVSITVRIIETGFLNIKDKGKNNYVWKFYRGPSCVEDSVLTNPKFETCIRLKTKKNSKTKEISDEKDELRPFLADIAGFKITIEAFLNKKGGEKCFIDPKDAYYGIKTEEIRTDNLAPGVWSEEIRIADAFGRFFAIIVYKFELNDGLSKIEFGGNNLINDVSKNIELNLPIKLTKKETLPFTWSYSIEGQNNWTTIPNSAEDKSKIIINPLNIFGNDPLLSSKKVDFKAEVQIGGKIEPSKTLTLTFAPSPPSFNKEKDMQVTPVCNGLKNGTVEIKNIKATASEIKYVLIKNPEMADQCNLKNASAEICPGFIQAEKVSVNNTLRIKSLAAGEYLLYIFNANIESGEVNFTTRFTITELTPFKIIDLEYPTKDPSCTNEKGGEIYMNVEGAANLWQIAIIPNKGNFKREGNRLIFYNLEAGKYTVYLSDQCGPEIRRTYTLKKPKQISINTNDITAILENNQYYILLNVLNGKNNYKVKVTDPENMVTEDSFSFLPEIKLPISKIGIHNIEIIDIATPNCQPARVKLKIEKSSKKEKFKFNVIE